MIRPLVIGIAVLSTISSQPTAAPTCDSSPLVVRNVNVWTDRGGLQGRDVVIRDGKVAAVEATRARSDRGMRIVDGTGHTLLPGLVDLHLHLVMPGGLPAGDTPRTDVADIAGRQLLRSGVTSGRLHLATLEDAVRLKTRSNERCAQMPRLQVGGPGLSGASDRDVGSFQGAKSREDARAKIQRFRAAGVDWIAIHDAERFADGVLDAIADAARKEGVRLMASGSTPQEIAAALRLRPDTLDYFDRTSAPQYSTSLLDAIRARGDLVLVPTPGVPYRTNAYLRDPASLEHDSNYELLNATDRAFLFGNAKAALDSADATRAQGIWTVLPEKFRQLRSLGLPMAIGSDAGSTLHFPAGAIWWELEAWRSLGVSHREALTAATSTGARALRRQDVGAMAVGRRGDFVLYKGDVEQGPFELARVLTVAKDGVLVVEAGRWTAQ